MVPSNRLLYVTLLALLTLGALGLSTSAEAKRVKPIENVENHPVPQGMSMDEIRSAIIDGASVRNWRVSEVAPGHLQATLNIRDHMARVDILYDQNHYSITYDDSRNLKYKDGKIHRNYNGWIQYLDTDIANALLRESN